MFKIFLSFNFYGSDFIGAISVGLSSLPQPQEPILLVSGSTAENQVFQYVEEERPALRILAVGFFLPPGLPHSYPAGARQKVLHTHQ